MSVSPQCAAPGGSAPQTRARTASWTAASTRAGGSCSRKRSPTLNVAASSTSPPASESKRTSRRPGATRSAPRPSRASSSCLLNPLTRQVSDLPPATTLYPLYRNAGMYDADPRLDFEVSGAGLADDDTVAVLFEEVQMLAVAKPGDEQWTLVRQGTSLSPAISFAGCFYCTTDSNIKMVETTGNQPPRLVVAAMINDQFFSRRSSTVHLLYNNGELMLLCCTNFAGARHFMHFKVSRVDLDARKTQPIRDLGGRAVFIRSTHAISVSPLAFPTIANDSVYLGKDHVTGSNLESTGPYKLVDGTGTTLSFNEGSGFYKNDKDSIPRYGPQSIIDYLSQYVTKGASDLFAEEDTSDSDYEANCIIC